MKSLFSTVLLASLLLLQISTAFAVTVSVRIATGNDDAEERISDGDMYRNSSDLELGYDNYQGGLQIIGMRFTNVAVPQGATINSAYIEFETDETDSGTTNLIIAAQDTDNAGAMSASSFDISNRTLTTSSVDWNSVPAWNSVNALNQTPDLSSVIQELVDRSGWSSGNDMLLVISPGSGCSGSNCQRTAEAYDGESSAAPLLVIDYTIGSSLLASFNLDEASGSINGTPGELTDQQGNITTAFALGTGSGVDTVSAYICNGITIPQNTTNGAQYGMDTSIDVDDAIGNSGTISFWYNSNNNWNGGGDRALFDASPDNLSNPDKFFHMLLRNNGSLRFALEDSNDSDYFFDTSSQAFTAGQWVHIIATWNMSGSRQIYINGALVATDNSGTTGQLGELDTLYFGDNRSTYHYAGTSNSANGVIDEVLIYNRVLSSTEIGTIYSNQLARNNYDGTPRSCAEKNPLAEYRFEEDSWNGTAGEVLDSSGNDYHGQMNNNSTPLTALPAIAGDPGTCGYASQTDGSIQVNGLPLDTTTSGVKTTVAFWMNWDGTNSVMPIGWRFHDLWIVSGAFGFNTWNNDVYGISSAGLSGGWHHIVAEFTNGNVSSNKIYVDGVLQTLTQRYGSPNNIRSYVNSELRIGGVSNSTNYDFHGLLDEVRLYEGTLSTAEVLAIMSETHPCSSTPSVDHYSISHGGPGITCSPQTVTITAHDAAHSPLVLTSDVSLTITTSPAVDAITSSPLIIASGQSSATFTITETAVTTAPHININVTDGSATENSGSAIAGDDPALVFVDSLLQFVTDTNAPPATIINTQIGGKPSTTAPNAQNLYLRAVRTDDTTGAAVCVAALDAGTHDVEMGYQCIDTNNCSANELSVSNTSSYNSSAATTISHNDGATTGNTSSVTLNFDATGYAPLSFVYDNVGEIALFANDYSTLSGAVINGGVSDQFVVRPFALTLDFDNGSNAYNMRELDWSDGNLDGSSTNISYSDPSTNPQNSTVFQTAGVNFPAEITGVLWQSADDSNNDGEPDSGVNLYNNNVASLFGQESSFTSQITHTLDQPVAGTVGVLTSTFSNPYVNGRTEGVMNWNEVGIIDIELALNNYLGDTTYSPSYIFEDVGRFIPANFQLKSGTVNDGQLDNSCGTFNYIGQDFTYLVNPAFTVEAINASSTVTTNYRGVWNKLTAASFPITTVTNDGNNALDILHTQTALSVTSGIGEADVVFGNDSFCYGLDVAGSCVKQANAQIAPFVADITMTLGTVSDGEVTTAIGQDFIPTNANLRFGRLAMENVFGSELIALVMPMRTQYFDGANFITNTDDACTTIDHMVVGELAVTRDPIGLSSTVSVLSTTAVGGVLDVGLTAPGAGNTGFIDVIPDLAISGETWLQYDWDSTVAGLENPQGRATFGIFNGNSRQIYYRQIFQ